MKENVTVDKAIARGHLIISAPAISILFIGPGLIITLCVQKVLPVWSIWAGLVAGFTLAWLYWSILVTKWRLWAFGNVRNVHELKRRAVWEGLILQDGNFFERTEIRSYEEKQKWSDLLYKFKQEDEFFDDPSIPEETVIFYSKANKYVNLVVACLALVVAVYLLVTTDQYFIGLALIVGSVFAIYKAGKTKTNLKPQIIINGKGIQVIGRRFYKWTTIEHVEVKSEGIGKTTRFYLIIESVNRAERIALNEFDISPRKLNKILFVYKGRGCSIFSK